MRQPSLIDGPEEIAPDLWLLPGFTAAAALWDDLLAVAASAPFRHMPTHTGYTTAAAMTNCGDVGWVSDDRGYAYATHDPLTGRRWPSMPAAWRTLARASATIAGFADFSPDACLVNCYATGAGMGRHVDDSERDFSQPIVSVSLGLSTTFAWWGSRPSGAGRNLLLQDGDVLVWGRSTRLGYHAVRPVPTGTHALCGAFRYNLTFRRAR